MWRAITESEQLSRWFPADLRGERRASAPIQIVSWSARFDPVAGLFTRYDPHRVLEYTWGHETLRWELTPDSGGCTLVFTNVLDAQAVALGPADIAAAWRACLDMLENVLDDATAPRRLLYSELTSWYRLVDPPADHVEEAAAYEAAFTGAIVGPADTLLELGAGAGHNALHLKRRFRCTLTDVSESMLALSREINPECEHVAGDMRSIRLGRTFDAVIVHDAVCYMASEQDLLAAALTAFVHTRPGGAAIFAPDHLRETFAETTVVIEGEDGSRALRCLMWTWDPDPADSSYAVDFAFLLRDGEAVQAVHDRHVEGLFPEATWHRVLASAGFEVETISRPIGEGATDSIFLCRRP